MNKTYIVDSTYEGIRIDRWIRNNLGKVPQSLIEKNLRIGKIKLNKKKIKSSTKLRKKDTINTYDLTFENNKINNKLKLSKLNYCINLINMYMRIVNLKFASEIEADAMQAYAEHELINKLPGILSIEVVRVTNLHSVVINKFQSQKHADESKDIIINKMKQNPNIKIEIFEGERLFIKEKS